MIKVDCVLDARARVGEGAIWSVAMQRLLWVDIPAGLVNRLDVTTGTNESWDMGRAVGCVAETASGQIVCALSDGFATLDPVSGKTGRAIGPRPEDRNHRFNDGTVDPLGRFIAGTMPLAGASDDDSDGRVYSFDGQNTTELMRGFHVINGLAFAPDGRTVYASDSYSPIQTIWAWDYELESGVLSNRRTFFDTAELVGRPDGGAIDSAGCYWSAGVGGWQLYRITPKGQLDMTIDMPVERPTRIAFGGSDLETLYVTSIRVDYDSEQPLSGGIFALEIPGVSGLPMPVMQFS